MCASMVDIQSATAEIRRGKKKKEQTTGWKYVWPGLLHRLALNQGLKYYKMQGNADQPSPILGTNFVYGNPKQQGLMPDCNIPPLLIFHYNH